MAKERYVFELDLKHEIDCIRIVNELLCRDMTFHDVMVTMIREAAKTMAKLLKGKVS
jgi:hypothetical protein